MAAGAQVDDGRSDVLDEGHFLVAGGLVDDDGSRRCFRSCSATGRRGRFSQIGHRHRLVFAVEGGSLRNPKANGLNFCGCHRAVLRHPLLRIRSRNSVSQQASLRAPWDNERPSAGAASTHSSEVTQIQAAAWIVGSMTVSAFGSEDRGHVL